jgi:hypothetical protein
MKTHLEQWEMWEGRQPARTEDVELGNWGIYGVGSRCQVTTGEDKADWDDLVRAIVNCKVWESVKQL